MGTFNLSGLGATSGMTLMVAYGSNLDPDLMYERVGPYKIHAVGVAIGQRLAFAGKSRRWGGPVATLTPTGASDEPAPVVLYWLDKSQMETMDANEGVGIGVYRRAKIGVHTELGPINAVAYLHNSPIAGKPTKAYSDVLRKGYKAFGFDTKILDAALRKAR